MLRVLWCMVVNFAIRKPPKQRFTMMQSPPTPKRKRSLHEISEDIPRAPVKLAFCKKRKLNVTANITRDIFRSELFEMEAQELLRPQDATKNEFKSPPAANARHVTFANPLTQEIPAPSYIERDPESSSTMSLGSNGSKLEELQTDHEMVRLSFLSEAFLLREYSNDQFEAKWPQSAEEEYLLRIAKKSRTSCTKGLESIWLS